MSLPASTVASVQHAVSDLRRPGVNYAPSIWGDFFLQYDSQSVEINYNMKEEAQILKEEVKKMFESSTSQNITHNINLIDVVQRLGISYHFEEEIIETLQQIYIKFTKSSINCKEFDLNSLALFFRLLRQQRYPISSDVFNKIKNEQGKLSETLANDLQGLCSLYDAANMRTKGDDILEEAYNFTRTHLKSLAQKLTPSLVAQINHCLNHPFNKSLDRNEVWYHITLYEQDPFHYKSLLSFAKVDFNILQKLHKKEIGTVTKWDISPIRSLPQCMKVVFETTVELCEEMEMLTADSRKSSFVVPHFKKAFADLVKAYMVEARWCHEGYIPTYDEYKVNGVVSSTCSLMITSFIGVGEFATEYVFDWIFSDSNIIKAISVIGRLSDDMGSHKLEQQRVHVASAVECCMKQYNISEEEAYVLIRRDVEDSWKVINEECLRLNDIPKPVLDCVFNWACMAEFTYENLQDKYTNGELLKGYVSSLLVDSISS